MKIQNTPFGSNPFKRAVAIATVALFLSMEFFNFVPAAWAQSANLKVQGGNPSENLHRLDRDREIRIPPELGQLEESFHGTSGKTILYLQDAHDSLEAQENIAKLIGHFVGEGVIQSVFEEGYEGPLPSDTRFGFIKDPALKRKVSYFFLDHLRIGGAEYAHINRSKDFHLIGADNIELHKANILQYRLSAEKREAISQDLKVLCKEVRFLAAKRFPKELLEWLKLRDRFDHKQLDLFTYLGRTLQLLGPQGSKNGVLKTEGAQQLLAPDLVLFILDALRSNDPAVLEKIKHIDAREVYGALSGLEERIEAIYLKGRVDKELLGYSKVLGLLERLDALEVTQEEYEAVKTDLKTFDTESLGRFINEHTGKSLVLSKQWERNVREALQFYEIAAARDHSLESVLEEQFLRGRSSKKSLEVAGDKEDAAILVYGGFHKENIKRILEAKGISYFVISPRITRPSPRHEAYYKRLMTVGSLPFERLIAPATATRPQGLFEMGDWGVAAIHRIYDVTQLNREVDELLLERYLPAFHPQPSRSETQAASVVAETPIASASAEARPFSGVMAEISTGGTEMRSEMRGEMDSPAIRQSILMTGQQEPREFELGKYLLRKEVELAPGEMREGSIYARESFEDGKYNLRVLFSPVKKAWAPNDFGHGYYLQLKKGPDGEWLLDQLWPYSNDPKTIGRFGGSGAAEAILSYCVQAIRESGRELYSADSTTWKAFRFYFSMFLSGKIPWPAKVRVLGEKGSMEWRAVTDPWVFQTLFDERNVGNLIARLNGNTGSVQLKLRATEGGRYVVLGVQDFSGETLHQGDKVTVDFPSGSIGYKGEQIGRVEQIAPVSHALQVGGYAAAPPLNRSEMREFLSRRDWAQRAMAPVVAPAVVLGQELERQKAASPLDVGSFLRLIFTIENNDNADLQAALDYLDWEKLSTLKDAKLEKSFKAKLTELVRSSGLPEDVADQIMNATVVLRIGNKVNMAEAKRSIRNLGPQAERGRFADDLAARLIHYAEGSPGKIYNFLKAGRPISVVAVREESVPSEVGHAWLYYLDPDNVLPQSVGEAVDAILLGNLGDRLLSIYMGRLLFETFRDRTPEQIARAVGIAPRQAGDLTDDSWENKKRIAQKIPGGWYPLVSAAFEARLENLEMKDKVAYYQRMFRADPSVIDHCVGSFLAGEFLRIAGSSKKALVVFPKIFREREKWFKGRSQVSPVEFLEIYKHAVPEDATTKRKSRSEIRGEAAVPLLRQFEWSEKDGRMDLAVILNGEKKPVIVAGRFIYAGPDALDLMMAVLSLDAFDPKKSEGIRRRQAMDWWSSFFERHTLGVLEQKAEKIHRVTTYNDEVSFTLADPVSGKPFYKTSLTRWHRRDRVNVYYSIESDPFKDTGLTSYAIPKILLEDPFYKDASILSLNFDSSSQRSWERLEASGQIRFLQKGRYDHQFAFLRPGTFYEEEPLPGKRTAAVFRDTSGQVYVRFGAERQARLVIDRNRVTHDVTAEEALLLRQMKIFTRDETGREMYRRLRPWIQKEHYVNYLREDFEELVRTSRETYELPEHLLDICERFGLDPVEVLDPVLSRDLPFTAEEEKVSVREIDAGVNPFERKRQAPNITWQKGYYNHLLDRIFKRRYPVFGNIYGVSPDTLEHIFGVKRVSELKAIAKKMMDARSEEMQKYLNFVIPTTTSFERKGRLFNFFDRVVLPDLVRMRGRAATLRFLSVGCSYGAEPYGLAIAALENKDLWKGGKIEIVATDVNRGVLEKARQGVFHADDVEALPKDTLEKYFIHDAAKGLYQVKPEVRGMVAFIESDILDGAARQRLGAFDYIMAMEVLSKYVGPEIDESRLSIMIEMLKQGGYVVGLDLSPELDFKGEFQSYRVYGPFEMKYANVGCMGGRPPLYRSDWVAQKLSPEAVRYEHFPGDELDIPSKDKLLEAIRSVYLVPEPEAEAELSVRFHQAIAPLDQGQVTALSFRDLWEYVRFYKDKKEPRIEQGPEGKFRVVSASGGAADFRPKEVDPPGHLKKVSLIRSEAPSTAAATASRSENREPGLFSRFDFLRMSGGSVAYGGLVRAGLAQGQQTPRQTAPSAVMSRAEMSLARATRVMHQGRYAASLEPLPYSPWKASNAERVVPILERLGSFDAAWEKLPKQGDTAEALGAVHRAFLQDLIERIHSGIKLPEGYGLDYVQAVSLVFYRDLPRFFAGQGFVLHIKMIRMSGQGANSRDYFYPRIAMPAQYSVVVKNNLRQDLNLSQQVLGDGRTPLILIQPARLGTVGGKLQLAPYVEPWKKTQSNELASSDGATVYLRADLLEQSLMQDKTAFGEAPGEFFAADLSLKEVVEGVRANVPMGPEGRIMVRLLAYPIRDAHAAAGYAILKLMAMTMRTTVAGRTLFDFAAWQRARFTENAVHEMTHVRNAHEPVWRVVWQVEQSKGDKAVEAEDANKADVLLEENARLEALRKAPPSSLKGLLSMSQQKTDAWTTVSNGDEAQRSILEAVLKEVGQYPDRYGIQVAKGGLTIEAVQPKLGEKGVVRETVTLDEPTQIIAQLYRVAEKPERVEALYTAVRKALNIDARAKALADKYASLDPVPVTQGLLGRDAQGFAGEARSEMRGDPGERPGQVQGTVRLLGDGTVPAHVYQRVRAALKHYQRDQNFSAIAGLLLLLAQQDYIFPAGAEARKTSLNYVRLSLERESFVNMFLPRFVKEGLIVIQGNATLEGVRRIEVPEDVKKVLRASLTKNKSARGGSVSYDLRDPRVYRPVPALPSGLSLDTLYSIREALHSFRSLPVFIHFMQQKGLKYLSLGKAATLPEDALVYSPEGFLFASDLRGPLEKNELQVYRLSFPDSQWLYITPAGKLGGEIFNGQMIDDMMRFPDRQKGNLGGLKKYLNFKKIGVTDIQETDRLPAGSFAFGSSRIFFPGQVAVMTERGWQLLKAQLGSGHSLYFLVKGTTVQGSSTEGQRSEVRRQAALGDSRAGDASLGLAAEQVLKPFEVHPVARSEERNPPALLGTSVPSQHEEVSGARAAGEITPGVTVSPRLSVLDLRSNQMTEVDYRRGEALSAEERKHCQDSLLTWDRSKVVYDWMYTRIIGWLSENSPHLKEIRFAISADGNVEGYVHAPIIWRQGPHFLSDPEPLRPSTLHVHIVESRPGTVYQGIGEGLFIAALGEFPREAEGRVAETKVQSARFKGLLSAALGWDIKGLYENPDVMLTRADIQRLQEYQSHRIEKWRLNGAAAEGTSGATLTGKEQTLGARSEMRTVPENGENRTFQKMREMYVRLLLKHPKLRLLDHLAWKSSLPDAHVVAYLLMEVAALISIPIADFLLQPAAVLFILYRAYAWPFWEKIVLGALVFWIPSLLRLFFIIVPTWLFSKFHFETTLRMGWLVLYNFVPFLGPYAVAGQLVHHLKKQNGGIGKASFNELRRLNDRLSRLFKEPNSGFSTEEQRGLKLRTPRLAFLILRFREQKREAWKGVLPKILDVKLDRGQLRKVLEARLPVIFIGGDTDYNALRDRLQKIAGPNKLTEFPFFRFETARFLAGPQGGDKSSASLQPDDVFVPLGETASRSEARAIANRGQGTSAVIEEAFLNGSDRTVQQLLNVPEEAVVSAYRDEVLTAAAEERMTGHRVMKCTVDIVQGKNTEIRVFYVQEFVRGSVRQEKVALQSEAAKAGLAPRVMETSWGEKRLSALVSEEPFDVPVLSGAFFEENDPRQFAESLGNALGRLHGMGVVHDDLVPRSEEESGSGLTREICLKNILRNKEGHLSFVHFEHAFRSRRDRDQDKDFNYEKNKVRNTFLDFFKGNLESLRAALGETFDQSYARGKTEMAAATSEGMQRSVSEQPPPRVRSEVRKAATELPRSGIPTLPLAVAASVGVVDPSLSGGQTFDQEGTRIQPVTPGVSKIVLVFEQTRIVDTMAPEDFRKLLILAGSKRSEIQLVIPDAVQGNDSARVAVLRAVASVSYRLPEIVKSVKIRVFGFSNMGQDTDTALKGRLDRLDPGITPHLTACFDLAGIEGVILALLVNQPGELQIKNGFLYDGTGRFHSELQTFVQNLVSNYVAIYSAA